MSDRLKRNPIFKAPKPDLSLNYMNVFFCFESYMVMFKSTPP